MLVATAGARIRRVQNFSGATILPSGQVALVLNAASLIRTALGRSPGATLARETAGAAPEAKKRLLESISRTGFLASSAFKDELGTSRKYAIPLLEHFDEIGLTVREGDGRVLRKT